MAKTKNKKQDFQPVNLDNTTPNGKNQNDVLYHLLDILYNLFGLKQLTYAIIYLLLFVVVIFAIKESIHDFFYPIASAVKYIDNHYHNSLYNILITTIAVVSIIGNIIQRKYYKREIKRISKSRKKVVHGRVNGDLSVLSNHNSSSSKELSKQIDDFFLLDEENT